MLSVRGKTDYELQMNGVQMLQKGEIAYNSRNRIKHGLKSNNLVRQINMQRRLQQQLKFTKTNTKAGKNTVLKGVSLSPKVNNAVGSLSR